jgi:hypothetical protein
VYTGAFLRLYIDAVQEGGDVTSTLPLVDHANPFTIGRESGGAQYFKGQMDDLRVWTAVQSQTTREKYGRRELDTREADLAFYAQFNEIGQGGAYDLVSQTWFTLSGGAVHGAGGTFWDDVTDPTDHTALALGDGDLESGWNNCRVSRLTYVPLAERTSLLELSGDEDPGFEGGQPAYLSNTSRPAPEATGKKTPLVRPFLAWPEIDREVDFQVKARWYAKKIVEVKAHHSARLLRLGQTVQLYAPNRFLQGERFKVVGLKIDGLDYLLTLRSWSIDAYTYARGAASAPTTLTALTDYSQTIPETPTAFTTGTDVYTIASNGLVTVERTVQATAPTTPNVTALIFILQDASGVQVGRREEPATSGQTKATIFDNLATGKTYYGRAYARAANNKPGYQDGTSTAVVTLTIGSTPGVPNAPTALTSTTKPGAILLFWTNPTNLDLAGIEVHRHTADSFSGDSTRIDVLGKTSGAVVSTYIDSAGVYGTLYYYAVRSVNSNGQQSAFSASTSQTLPKVTTQDRQPVNTQSVTGGILAPYTRRVALYTHSLGIVPMNSPEVSGTPYASILFGPWQVSSTIVSAWAFNADSITSWDAGNTNLMYWTVLVALSSLLTAGVLGGLT